MTDRNGTSGGVLKNHDQYHWRNPQPVLFSEPDRPNRPGLTEWNSALIEILLPYQKEPHSDVLLCCDDDVVRAAAIGLGVDPARAVQLFAAAVRSGYSIGETGGFKYAAAEGGGFQKLPRPRPLPGFLALLCLFVLAATHMEGDKGSTAAAYYPRLRGLLGFPEAGGTLEYFNCTPSLFGYFRRWLAEDLAGSRGCLASLGTSKLPWVGECVSQTVFRQADLNVLGSFFELRLEGVNLKEIDALVLLKHWGGRHRLTRHARALIESVELDELVRSALMTAYRNWDGTVPDVAAGGLRGCRGTLVIQPGPPVRIGVRTSLGYRVWLSSAGQEFAIEPTMTGWLPEGGTRCFIQSLIEGQTLDAKTDAGSRLAVRIVPNHRATVFFAPSPDGVLQIWPGSPAQDLLALSSDPRLISELDTDAERHYCSEDLPPGWALFHSVDFGQLGSSSAPVSRQIVTMDADLAVGARQYLIGLGPHLTMAVDAEHEQDEVPVFVNGEYHSVLTPGESQALPSDHVGSYEVVVGDGLFRSYYHVVDHGPREGHGKLVHRIDPSVLRRGAALDKGEPQSATICGPIVLPRSANETLPLLRRGRGLVVTIDRLGVCREYETPTVTPGWLSRVTGDYHCPRWEIPVDGVVWIVQPSDNNKTSCCVADFDVILIDTEVAEWIVEIAPECDVKSDFGIDQDTASDRWRKLTDHARELVSKNG